MIDQRPSKSFMVDIGMIDFGSLIIIFICNSPIEIQKGMYLNAIPHFLRIWGYKLLAEIYYKGL